MVPTPRPQQLNNKTNSQMGAQRGETILGPAELNPISNLGVLVQTLPAVVGVERQRGRKKRRMVIAEEVYNRKREEILDSVEKKMRKI